MQPPYVMARRKSERSGVRRPGTSSSRPTVVWRVVDGCLTPHRQASQFSRLAVEKARGSLRSVRKMARLGRQSRTLVNVVDEVGAGVNSGGRVLEQRDARSVKVSTPLGRRSAGEDRKSAVRYAYPERRMGPGSDGPGKLTCRRYEMVMACLSREKPVRRKHRRADKTEARRRGSSQVIVVNIFKWQSSVAHVERRSVF